MATPIPETVQVTVVQMPETMLQTTAVQMPETMRQTTAVQIPRIMPEWIAIITTIAIPTKNRIPIIRKQRLR